MHILFIVPDGTGIRNYLFSDVLKHLQAHQITVWHSLPQGAVNEIKKSHPFPIQFISIPTEEPNKLRGLYRDLLVFAQLNRNSRIAKNPAIRYSLTKLWKQHGAKRFLYKCLDVAGRLLSHHPAIIQRMDKRLDAMLLQSAMGKHCRQTLEQLKPSVVFCTHQRSSEGGYITAAANALNIPTISVIYSWDNLPKSRIATRSLHYFVWSRYMLNEMKMYYPLVPTSNLHITGTPQFEAYKNPALIWPEALFRKNFMLPQGKKIICFSGNDLSLPNDHLYLKDVLSQIQQLPEAERPHIIVRPAPVDNSGRFQQVIPAGCNFVTYMPPLWITPPGNNWATVYPTPVDNEWLVNLCYHADMVINVGSTVGIDFSMFNKPAMYLHYEQPENPWFKLSTIFNMQHFRTLQGLDAVVWVNNKEAILPAILQTLQKPHAVATQRLQWRKIIMDDIFDASKTIANSIIEIGKQG